MNRLLYPLNALTILHLDPLIRRAVLVLHDGGIETYESCQGGDGHSYSEPTVAFHGGPGEGFRAFGIAVQHRLPVREVQRVWSAHEPNELDGPTWHVTFRADRLRDEYDPARMAEWLERLVQEHGG